eukprot:8507261-Alexandrium_andersonii.AAC.1
MRLRSVGGSVPAVCSSTVCDASCGSDVRSACASPEGFCDRSRRFGAARRHAAIGSWSSERAE